MSFVLRAFTLLMVTLWLFTIPATAGQLPVLAEKAKVAPTRTSSSLTTPKTQSSLVTLGSPKSISDVKRRVGKAAVRTSQQGDIAKKISSKSVVIMDGNTGETLYAKNPDHPRQPASTIKVLTGMIALQSLEGSEEIPVSRRASDMPRSKIWLDPKKNYLANDLINAVLLASANDASVALAEKIAGNENDFAEMMTVRAKLWGANMTICRTATGLTAKGQQSTARDLATIFRYAMQDEEFASRMHRRKVLTSYGQDLFNHNKALWRVDGAEGGKTGYTAAARQTYVGQFTRGEDTIIVAIMGSETMWTDIKRLVEYGFQKQEQIQVARIDGYLNSSNVAQLN